MFHRLYKPAFAEKRVSLVPEGRIFKVAVKNRKNSIWLRRNITVIGCSAETNAVCKKDVEQSTGWPKHGQKGKLYQANPLCCRQSELVFKKRSGKKQTESV